MYQINLSAHRRYDYWINYIRETVGDKIVGIEGIWASNENKGRINLCFAVPATSKPEAKEMLRSAIVDCFIIKEKKAYFNALLDLIFCDVISRQMLINTLATFNCTAERLFITSKLKLTTEFNMDGFYNFRLKELIRQWKESVEMITNNAEIVKNEDTFNVMLKFLLSGIDAKIKEVHLSQRGKSYALKNPLETEELGCFNEGQLLVRLAEIAPEKIVISGVISNENLRRKLSEIFCVK